MDEPAPDPHNLQRFVDAQAPVYAQVLDELRSGRKRTHWMWFIFPQIAGLGSSPMAQVYAISGRTVEDIFGYPDNPKFRSSVTLFSSVAPTDDVFRDALKKYFTGQPDSATLALL